jgi:hypothetical protein
MVSANTANASGASHHQLRGGKLSHNNSPAAAAAAVRQMTGCLRRNEPRTLDSGACGSGDAVAITSFRVRVRFG